MRFVCQVCGYVYDDSKEKTPFSALPDDWTCPLCGASKADFQPEQTPAEPSPSVPECMQEDLQQFARIFPEAVKSSTSPGKLNFSGSWLHSSPESYLRQMMREPRNWHRCSKRI